MACEDAKTVLLYDTIAPVIGPARDPQKAVLHHRLIAEWLHICYIVNSIAANNCKLNSDIKLIGKLNLAVSSKFAN